MIHPAPAVVRAAFVATRCVADLVAVLAQHYAPGDWPTEPRLLQEHHAIGSPSGVDCATDVCDPSR